MYGVLSDVLIYAHVVELSNEVKCSANIYHFPVVKYSKFPFLTFLKYTEYCHYL